MNDSASVRCRICGAPLGPRERFCSQCGTRRPDAAFFQPTVPPQNTTIAWSPIWAVAAGIAASLLSLLIFVIMRRRRPDELFDDSGNFHAYYERIYQDCLEAGGRVTDCIGVPQPVPYPWYLENYLWVSPGIGVIVTLIALLMIIASRTSPG